jgi:hypothetical protein
MEAQERWGPLQMPMLQDQGFSTCDSALAYSPIFSMQ